MNQQHASTGKSPLAGCFLSILHLAFMTSQFCNSRILPPSNHFYDWRIDVPTSKTEAAQRKSSVVISISEDDPQWLFVRDGIRNLANEFVDCSRSVVLCKNCTLPKLESFSFLCLLICFYLKTYLHPFLSLRWLRLQLKSLQKLFLKARHQAPMPRKNFEQCVKVRSSQFQRLFSGWFDSALQWSSTSLTPIYLMTSALKVLY